MRHSLLQRTRNPHLRSTGLAGFSLRATKARSPRRVSAGGPLDSRRREDVQVSLGEGPGLVCEEHLRCRFPVAGVGPWVAHEADQQVHRRLVVALVVEMVAVGVDEVIHLPQASGPGAEERMVSMRA